MSENNNSRSGAQTAANLARAAKAAYRIIQAAAVSGAYGTAVAAAKEALPFLIKILIGVLIAVVVIPMVIFTALPNIFFGYNSSDTDTMPEVVGLMLWKEGHVGVYIGNGYVIEAMGTRKGVVKTELAGRGWQGWCKLPYINYLEVE